VTESADFLAQLDAVDLLFEAREVTAAQAYQQRIRVCVEMARHEGVTDREILDVFIGTSMEIRNRLIDQLTAEQKHERIS
jgi:hypothetical protein